MVLVEVQILRNFTLQGSSSGPYGIKNPDKMRVLTIGSTVLVVDGFVQRIAIDSLDVSSHSSEVVVLAHLV